MNNIPLDLPAQVTQIAWTIQDYPETRNATQSILRRCLDLAGVREINALKARKLQGLTVFEQTPVYPQGGKKDAETLRTTIRELRTTIPEISAPVGAPVPAGVGWAMPTQTGTELDLETLYYTPPL